MEVTVQVPESSFSALRTTPEKFASEMKLAAVVKWYELGKDIPVQRERKSAA